MLVLLLTCSNFHQQPVFCGLTLLWCLVVVTSGTVPSQLRQLTKLELLRLEQNQLVGPCLYYVAASTVFGDVVLSAYVFVLSLLW